MRSIIVKTLMVVVLVNMLLASVPFVNASGDHWVSKTQLPEAMSGCKAAVAYGKIYVMGATTNYEYNPETDKWSTKASMPTPRTSFAVAEYKNKSYVVGGSTSYSYEVGSIMTGKNEVFDPATNTWQTRNSMPVPSMLCEANTANDLIFVMGGLKDPQKGGASNLNQAYDPENDTWILKAFMPTPVFKYASASIDDKIFIMGGEGRDTPGNLNQIYNAKTDTWTFGKNMSGPSNGAGAAKTTGSMASQRIYVIGGRQGYSYDVSTANQIYDPTKDAWSTGASMKKARQGLAVVAVNDRIYAIGGSYPEFQSTSSNSASQKITTISHTTSPVNFMPYDNCATNEQYTPLNYEEPQNSNPPTPTQIPSPTPTMNADPSTPSLNPNATPSLLPFEPSSSSSQPINPSPTLIPNATDTTPIQSAESTNNQIVNILNSDWIIAIVVLLLVIPLVTAVVKFSRGKAKQS